MEIVSSSSSSWHRLLGGQCLSLAHYVAVTGTRGRATATGGPFMLPSLTTRRHTAISPPRGLYAMPSLCGCAGSDPRVVPCFRCPLCLDMSPAKTPGSPSAACAQFLRRRHWPSPRYQRLGTPKRPSSASDGGYIFRGWLGSPSLIALATTCRVARFPWRVPPTLSGQQTEASTPGLPPGRSLFLLPGITTAATGQVPPAGLPPTRASASIAARYRDIRNSHKPPRRAARRSGWAPAARSRGGTDTRAPSDGDAGWTYVGDRGKCPVRALAGLLVVEAREEAVEDLLAADLALAFGVVALLLERGAERDRRDEEGAGLAEGLEVAVHFDRASAVAVAEHAAVHLDPEAAHLGPLVSGGQLVGLVVEGFDLLGDGKVLVGDGLVGDARVDHGHGESLVAEQGRDGVEAHPAIDGLGGERVAELMRGDVADLRVGAEAPQRAGEPLAHIIQPPFDRQDLPSARRRRGSLRLT